MNNIFFKKGSAIEKVADSLYGCCGLSSAKRAVRFVEHYRNPLYTDGLKALKRALTEDYDGVALRNTLAPWKSRSEEWKSMTKEAFSHVMLGLSLTQDEIDVLLSQD